MGEITQIIAAELHRGQEGIPSGLWQRWYTIMDKRACIPCKKNNGKIYSRDEEPSPEPPLHHRCRCIIDEIEAIIAGTASIAGVMGADWFLKYHHMLPRNYLTRQQAESLGWVKRKGNLAEVAPDMPIGGDIYWHSNRKLPSAPGRTWYEGDINYVEGYRVPERYIVATVYYL